MSISRTAILLLAFFLLPTSAKFDTPDCPDYKTEEFRYVKLVTKQSDTSLSEPVRMAFDYRGEGRSDIYFAERHGNIKRWDAVKNEITVLIHLDVFSDSPDKLPYAAEAETGVNGIALDPDFKNNNRIWVFYSPWTDTVFRLSHFTVKDGKMGSEKILLDIPEGRKHGSTISIPGGPLHFDSKGDLWIAIGANSEQFPSVDERIRKRSAEASSSNLADLRGSILRIHPDGSIKGYSVPKGNLGEYWSAEYARQGRASMAAEYADPAKVRVEIYIKGTRNPYSMNVDPVTGAVVWGEFGPNKLRVEELNLANHPLYAGYPYWAGKNIFVLDQMAPYNTANMDPKAPLNISVWNEGPDELPPSEPSVISYAASDNGFLYGNHPISGPVYRYQGQSDSHVKFPPHFDGAWMVLDRYGGLRLFKLNAAGDGYVDSVAFSRIANEPSGWARPVEAKQGPDGAVYVIDYAGYHATTALTHIGRYEYSGTCLPGNPTGLRARLKPDPAVRITSRTITVDRPGEHVLRIRTLEGREIARFTVNGPAEYPLTLPSGKSLYIITLDEGPASWVVPRF